ncbi:MAG: DEAD/DEAH box helicase [Thermoplasmatota archaeon]
MKDGLHPTLREVMHGEGLTELTEPQRAALPPLLRGDSCLVIAPTGMGKTEAALIPLFQRLLDNGTAEGVSLLYVTPLRALNRDMLRRTLSWGEQLGIDIAVRHGDTTRKERRRQSLHPPDMLITTPETVQILFTGSRLRKSLEDVRYVVVDEVHELASSERGAQLAVALERIAAIAGPVQRVGLSATVGSPDEVAEFLSGGRPIRVIETTGGKDMDIQVLLPEATAADRRRAAELGVDPHMAAVLRVMQQMLDEHVSVLLFVNTRDSAELLAAHLHEAGASIEVHHGSLSKDTRIAAEDAFKNGEVRALICTSSLELGIDVGHTDYVIQFNSPRQVTRLVQRVGRSEHRAGATARGAIVATTTEDYAEARVIARRTMQGRLEPTRIRRSPLAVLANQIISIAVEYRSIDSGKMYDLVHCATPFHDLDRDTFEAVLQQLHQQRILWYDGGSVNRKRKSRQYFLDNISMIPDEKNVDVVDMSGNQQIGTLDESFVVDYCEPGARFIMRGRTWEVVERTDTLKVAPAGRTSMTPDWSGEEIPVPFEIARAVGAMRRRAAAGGTTDGGTDDVIEEQVRQQQNEGFAVPSDRLLTIEVGEETVYITTHYGTRTNETVGRILASLLAQRLGQNVGMDSDSYRIYLRIARPIPASLVREILDSIDPDSVEALLRVILRRSSFIRWELIKVARKFGVLNKDADPYLLSLDALMDVFSDMPMMEEVIDRVIWQKMDIGHAMQALHELRDGRLDMQAQHVSPMSRQGEAPRGEVLRPGDVDAAVLRSLEQRLMKARISLRCMNCSHEWHSTVKRATPECPQCGSRMVAVARGSLNSRRHDELVKSASLVAEYGKQAMMVLAGYGVGPRTAARILGMQLEGNALLKEILQAEITYSRTRQFWD